MHGDMRKRKPKVDLLGFENDHGIVIGSDRPLFWKIKCKHCEGIHEQNGREIQANAYTRKCSMFKPHNHSGLEKWDAVIRRTYGISLAEYDAMLEKQGGGCAICGKTVDVGGRRLPIDHCHETAKVRGILCSHCNQGIGHFFDSPDLLMQAATYLKYANAR